MTNTQQQPTATLVRGPYTWKADDGEGTATRCLWETSTGDHILTSSIHIPRTILNDLRETMAFPADETGSILDFGELACVGYDQHQEAIESAGYTIKENK